MKNGTYGGLAGQSRRVRYRNRADRLHTQHLIDEYLEPDEEPDREIPIKGRSDFLPTVAGSAVEATEEAGMQLELPLDAAVDEQRDEQRTSSVEDIPTCEEPEPARSETRHDPRPHAEDKGDPVRWGSQDITAFTETRRKDFEVGKFLYGCLIGGSAAAALLVVLQFVV